MSQIKIAVIVGSIRKDSLNRKLATALARLAPADFLFEQVPLDALPLYNQDHDSAPTAEVTRFKDAIKSAQGLLFVTPEYNRSIPGVLKNALDRPRAPTARACGAASPPVWWGCRWVPSAPRWRSSTCATSWPT